MLTVYNTLTRRKEPFTPIQEGKVRMYVCGPTVYDSPHLGHARAAVVFDVIRRWLETRYKVVYVSNFTDVDDKIINRAAERGEDWRTLATRHRNEYLQLMDVLGVKRADHYPEATKFIPEMQGLIARLIEKGHAYATPGGVYFAVESFPGYGKLSGRTPEGEKKNMRARLDDDPHKRDGLDFALWKAAKPGEPFWESPWGRGRPGWHIECSAMSEALLGLPFDIHGGGADLVFPHHENEIAQSEAACGGPFARYFLHNGFVTLKNEKMAKSTGNVFSLKEAIEKYGGLAVRMWLLSAHYRAPLRFLPESLLGSSKALQFLRAGKTPRSSESTSLGEFEGCMKRDFNFAGAMGILLREARKGNWPSKKLVEILLGEGGL